LHSVVVRHMLLVAREIKTEIRVEAHCAYLEVPMRRLLILFASACFLASPVVLRGQQPKVVQPQQKASKPQPSQQPAKKPAPQGSSYDGTWNGKTSQGKALRFTVEKGRITSFFAEGRVAGAGCSAESNITANVNQPLSGSIISVNIHGGPGGLSFQVKGEFASASFAQGAASMELHPVPGPPGTPSCSGFARATWTAWKGDKPPDEATLARLTAAPKRSRPSLVKLISPAEGEVLDNGCTNFKKPRVWEFRWSETPRAQRYHLYVIHEFAGNPVVDKSDIRDTTFADTDKGYIPSQNLEGWKWKVRPMVGGVWKDWSDEQTFNVEPPNKDCDEWERQFLEAAGKGDAARLRELMSLEWAETGAYTRALTTAAEKGYAEVVKMLLAAGAEANSSALTTAAEKGYAEIAKMLLAAGAIVNAGGHFSQLTPLMAAASEGHTEVVQALLEAGADVNKGMFGEHETALYYAAQKGHAETARLLLQKGANPNGGEGARWGKAPLLAAVENGHTEVVRALLEAGADVRVTKFMGGTALELAREKGNVEIIRLLQEATKRRP
jgi:ankyrin repeat protein